MITKSKIFLTLSLLIFISTNAYSAKGYELFYNGKRVAHKTNMNLYQSVGSLHVNIKKYRSKKVSGYYNNVKIYASAKGYELYYAGHRRGYKPNWTLQQAVESLHINKKKYPNIDIRAWYNGNKI